MKFILFSLLVVISLVGKTQEPSLIRGVIKDVRTQKTIPLVSIKVYENDSLVSDFTSNEDGEFTISRMRGGNYTLKFEKLDYKPWSQEVSVALGGKKYTSVFLISTEDTLTSPDQICTLPGVIRGYVFDSVTGETEPFVTVKVFEGENVIQATQTDVDGIYNIRNLKPGTYKMTFESISYESYTVDEVIVMAGENTTLKIELIKANLPELIPVTHTGCR